LAEDDFFWLSSSDGASPGHSSTPLGLAPINEANNFGRTPTGAGTDPFLHQDPDLNVGAPPGTNFPMSELECDDQFGADVSVMESLGGPSLLIDNQQRSQMAAVSEQPTPMSMGTKTVSPDLIMAYAHEYPGGEEAIESDPDRFYRHVVHGLLERNEPEKVRLLDKLLAKYDGREEHLITKLSVRYEGNEANAAAAATAEAAAAPAQFETFGGTNTFTSTPASAGNASGDVWGASAPSPGGAQPQAAQNKAGPDVDGVSEMSGSKDNESYSSGEFSGSSIDGTSPAVIAQVSELLNYVYGKTSVPGQIDRVSTIMRAYEGREAVLLELLETKALIKANAEGDSAIADLPASLRDSPALAANQRTPNAMDRSTSFDKKSATTPSRSSPTATTPANAGDENHDNNAAMRPKTPETTKSLASAPEDEKMGFNAMADDNAADDDSAPFQDFSPAPTPTGTSSGNDVFDAGTQEISGPSSQAATAATTSAAALDETPTKKKKKGIFKKAFGSIKKSSKKESKKAGKSGKNAGLLRVDSREGSI